MAKVEKLDERHYGYKCPGCGQVKVLPTLPGWQFNDDVDCPSFNPSIKIPIPGGGQCVSFVWRGQIIFRPGTTHKLAGQTVDMEDIPPGGHDYES